MYPQSLWHTICPLGMHAFTRIRVLYMINYRVNVYKLHNRCIPNGEVGVGVGPVEFKLNRAGLCDRWTTFVSFMQQCQNLSS